MQYLGCLRRLTNSCLVLRCSALKVLYDLAFGDGTLNLANISTSEEVSSSDASSKMMEDSTFVSSQFESLVKDEQLGQ
jgi:hypothetical protein